MIAQRQKLTATEKAFKSKMAGMGRYTYRDESTGRIVTNCDPEEVQTLRQKSGMSLEVVDEAVGFKVSAVEPSQAAARN